MHLYSLRGAIPARWFFAALVVSLVCGGGGAVAQTADRVVTTAGTVSGRITLTAPNEVQLEDRAGETRKIPIDQIREVQFGGEPAELKSARSMLSRGRPADALEELTKIAAGDLESWMRDSLDAVDPQGDGGAHWILPHGRRDSRSHGHARADVEHGGSEASPASVHANVGVALRPP